MNPITAFQPKWVSMYTRFQFQTLATITTGGDANWVNTPPTEILTNSKPSVAYFSDSDGLRKHMAGSLILKTPRRVGISQLNIFQPHALNRYPSFG
jgi:hypothetical protein